MAKSTFRANATEINKRPRDLKYIFIIESKRISTDFTVATTYKTLNSLLNRDNVLKVYYINVKTYEIGLVKLESLEELLQEWRENYFNIDWEISPDFQEVKF